MGTVPDCCECTFLSSTIIMSLAGNILWVTGWHTSLVWAWWDFCRGTAKTQALQYNYVCVLCCGVVEALYLLTIMCHSEDLLMELMVPAAVLEKYKLPLPSTHLFTVRLWEWVRPMQTTLHPLLPPTSLQISPRLSPQPPTLGSLQEPHRGPCQTFAFIAVWTGEKERWGPAAIRGSGRVRGVWKGQCHTKGGQEGKISHPWSVRQRTLFLGVGGVHSGAVNK